MFGPREQASRKQRNRSASRSLSSSTLARAKSPLRRRRSRLCDLSRSRGHDHGDRCSIDPAALGADFEGRTALLSPFDRLVYDRRRAQELFEFEYTLEMYKPAAKRRWGYYALPVLHDDRLVAKVDATADRNASVLRVHAIHEDVRFTRTMTKAVEAELDDLASWLGLRAAEP